MAVKQDQGKLELTYLSGPLVAALQRAPQLPLSVLRDIGRVGREILGFLELGGGGDVRGLVRAFQICDFRFSGMEGKGELGISLEFMQEMVRVREFGAKKYSRDNWKLGFKYRRGLDAALRHLVAYLGGQELDPESGLTHLGHLGCSLEHVIYTVKRYKGGEWDDRFRPL